MYMCTGVQYGILKAVCTVPYRCIHIVHVCNMVTNVACTYVLACTTLLNMIMNVTCTCMYHTTEYSN